VKNTIDAENELKVEVACKGKKDAIFYSASHNKLAIVR